MVTSYYSGTSSQRGFQPEMNYYANQRSFSSKPYNEQYQAIPNVGKMTLGQMPLGYLMNNQPMNNYHYSQMDQTMALASSKLPSQYANPNPMMNSSISANPQVKGSFHDTLNRNFFNSNYVYNNNQKQPTPQYAHERKDNGNLHPNPSFMQRPLQANAGINYINSQQEEFPMNKGQMAREYQKSATVKSFNNTTVPQRINQTPLSNLKNTTKVNYVIEKWSANSKAGKVASGMTKTNQDSYLVKETKCNGKPLNLIGVFDGHGPHGHFVSKAIKTYFSNVEFNNKSEPFSSPTPFNPPQAQYSGQQLNILNDKSHLILKQKFEALSSYVTSNKAYDSNLSGSTCVIAFVSENKLLCANCGDSRAIMIQDNGRVIPLSRDHKPDLPDEMDRIIKSGGRVGQVPYPIKQGPFRVWLKNEDYPGLAMSRSIGDQVAKSIGVTAEPEVFEFDLAELKPKMIIVASDGVWEFLSNSQVNQIVMPYYSSRDCDGASKRLVEVALEMWKKEEPVVDDITAVVVFFTQSKL